jgi:hypothetical protein
LQFVEISLSVQFLLFYPIIIKSLNGVSASRLIKFFANAEADARCQEILLFSLKDVLKTPHFVNVLDLTFNQQDLLNPTSL